jgi:hypothetical protein
MFFVGFTKNYLSRRVSGRKTPLLETFFSPEKVSPGA